MESFIQIAQEINGREPILSQICIAANVQENVILHTKLFISAKLVPKLEISHCRKKLDLRKNKLFRDRPSRFCSRYPNICDRTKKKNYMYKSQDPPEDRIPRAVLAPQPEEFPQLDCSDLPVQYVAIVGQRGERSLTGNKWRS
jgi:hypothetical protein